MCLLLKDPSVEQSASAVEEEPETLLDLKVNMNITSDRTGNSARNV